MAAVLDDLGTWNDLGEVTPELGTFTAFPLPASAGFNVFRVIWGGNLINVQTFCYLKAFYIRGITTIFESQWRKLYPKPGEEIITIPFAPEFELQQLERWLEVEKWAKQFKLSRGILDPTYSIRLLEFVPYPETIATIQQQELTPAATDAIAATVIQQIRANFSLPSNTLPPPP